MKVTIWSNNVGHQIRSQQVFINTMYTFDTLTAVAVQGTPFPRMSECPDEVKHVNAREPTIPKKIGKNKRAKKYLCGQFASIVTCAHFFFVESILSGVRCRLHTLRRFLLRQPFFDFRFRRQHMLPHGNQKSVPWHPKTISITFNVVHRGY